MSAIAQLEFELASDDVDNANNYATGTLSGVLEVLKDLIWNVSRLEIECCGR